MGLLRCICRIDDSVLSSRLFTAAVGLFAFPFAVPVMPCLCYVSAVARCRRQRRERREAQEAVDAVAASVDLARVQALEEGDTAQAQLIEDVTQSQADIASPEKLV